MISLFFAVKSRFDTPVFMPRMRHSNVINDSSNQNACQKGTLRASIQEMGGFPISFIRGRDERMEIFSIFSLLDTVISVTNGCIALRDHFKNAREKQKKDDMFIHADGRRYEGDLRDGAAHGRGVVIYPDGTRCEGEFRRGEPAGRMVICWPDGRQETGEWRERRFYADDVRLNISVKHPVSGANVALAIHPAFASDEPFFLEYAGDTATALFDRWLCYQRAFERATALNAANLERVLQKIALLETEPDAPRSLFERMAQRYEAALKLCRQPASSVATFTDAIRDLEDCGELLGSTPTITAFFAPLLHHLRQAFAAAIARTPVLRRQHAAQLAQLPGFQTDTLRLRWDGAAQAFLLLSKPHLTLGRSDQSGQASDIFILDTSDPAQKTTISRFHAIIEYTPHGFQIMPDKNHYQIWIERGTQTLDVTRPTMLASYDLIRLGKQADGQGVALRYAAYYGDDAAAAEISIDKHVTLDDDAPQQSLIAARLTVERGIAPYRTIILCVGACAIGRDDAQPLRLDDQRVSRWQAVISHQQGGFSLQDAGSRNGTFVNDESCAEATPLLVGDTIRFGKNITLRVG